MFNFKAIFTFLVVLILLTPAIVGYILQLHIGAFADFAISIYGIYSLVYLICQIVFTEINTKKQQKKVNERSENWAEYGVGLVVVGYREDKHLLKRCLESIRNNKYTNLRRIVFVIDGNEEDDLYMAEIYNQVFNDNIVKVDFLVSNMKENIQEALESFSTNDNICIMQPHAGKREGLYTGFKVLMQDPNVRVIVTTDSDTILDENAIKELAFQCTKDSVGAVAGQIHVWNKSESLLTHIVAHRYWFSFNLERSAESFWETVMCVAGPMACYKVDVLKDIIEEWFNQTFFGERCTFGDDRHLTNRVLLKGKKVVYTEHAVGYTDTPASILQYFKQQTRWSKSYFREFLFNMQSIHLHPIWMCYELLYNMVYFFLLMYWCLYILYFCSIYQQAIAVLVTLTVSLLKCLYAVIKTKDLSFFYYYLYSFVYFLTIIPAKLAALLTIWDTKWGTRGKKDSFLYSFWSPILWIMVLTGGFAYTIYKNHTFEFNTNHRYKVAFIAWISYLGFVILTLISEFILRRMKMFMTDLEKDIIKEKSNVINN